MPPSQDLPRCRNRQICPVVYSGCSHPWKMQHWTLLWWGLCWSHWGYKWDPRNQTRTSRKIGIWNSQQAVSLIVSERDKWKCQNQVKVNSGLQNNLTTLTTQLRWHQNKMNKMFMMWKYLCIVFQINWGFVQYLFVCLFWFNVAFNKFSVISRWWLVATRSSMLPLIVLPHWSINFQTLNMTPHPVTLFDTGSTSPSSTP